MKYLLLLTVLLCAGAVGLSQTAAPVAAESEAPAKFQVKAGSIAIPERGLVPTTILLTEGFAISFMPPAACTTTVQKEQQKISFSSVKTQMALSVKVNSTPMPDDMSVQQKVVETYPGAEIAPVSTVISAAGTGRSYDVKRVFQNKTVMLTRHGFIPFSGGYLEIIFTSDADSFDNQISVFTWVINSLKIERRP